MARPAAAVIVQGGGGGSAAGILLLLVAIAGLLALFTGNLDRILESIGAPAGGAAGINAGPDPGGRVIGGQWGQPVAAPRAAAPRAGTGGAAPV